MWKLIPLIPFQICHADFEAIISQIQQRALLAYPGRSTPSFIQNLPDLNGWGCWCMFDAESQNGYGVPINDPLTVGVGKEHGIDKACQVLSHGYHCSLLDAQKEGDGDCVQNR